MDFTGSNAGVHVAVDHLAAKCAGTLCAFTCDLCCGDARGVGLHMDQSAIGDRDSNVSECE